MASQRAVWQQLWSRWSASPPPFHLTAVNPNLVRWYERWIGAVRGDAHAACDAGRVAVLVPLCGKSVDMLHLAQRGHTVVGIEIVDAPAEQLRDEYLPDLVRCADSDTSAAHAGDDAGSGGGQPLPPWVTHTWQSTKLPVTVLIGDIMAAPEAGSGNQGARPPGGRFPLAWDRGGITSVHPRDAAGYLRRLHALMEPGGALLLESVTGSPTLAESATAPHGPESIAALCAGLFQCQQLDSQDVSSSYPGAQHPLQEHVMLLSHVPGADTRDSAL